jgi:transposase
VEDLAVAKRRPPDPKLATLRQQRSLNPIPEAVRDPLFHEDEFFDPRDLVQVRYEMLRRVQRERQPVTQAAATFGLSRQSYYNAQADFRREGLPGLVPKKRGPRCAHKLTPEVLDFLAEQREEDPKVSGATLACRLEKRFQLRVHRRTIERALRRAEKKTP